MPNGDTERERSAAASVDLFLESLKPSPPETVYPAMRHIKVGATDLPLYVTTADTQASWWDEELACFCHLVVKAGEVMRYISFTMSGLRVRREEPFDVESRWGV